MLKRTLLLAAGVGLSFTATALADRPDFRADGSVQLGQKVFPTVAAYHASPEFQQSGARCGTPHLTEAEIAALAPADCSMASTTINPMYNDDRTIVIQVVWHIIKRTDGVGDLPVARITSQMDVLNEDFQALAGSLGAPGTNTKIKFVMAKFDPNGQPTTGINVVTNNQYFNDPGPGANNPMKTALRWDTTRYFNIYTNDGSGNGTLGYATFPQQDAGGVRDGVVLNHLYVGRNAPMGGVYNLGRTATHEVGHYLGLFHTFQGGCGTAAQPYTSGDLIMDTNREQNPNFGCTPSASTCAGAGANPIENYMDYSDDRCMTKFTPEQTNRMRCAIMNYRTVNTEPRAQFTYTAADTAVTFTNTSMDAETTLPMLKSKWTFGDGTMSTEASPVHTYPGEGTYQVTLEVIDPGSGTSTTTQSLVVVVTPTAPDAGIDPGGGGDDGGGDEGGGCCQTPNGDVTYALCALPVVLVLLRRRRRRA